MLTATERFKALFANAIERICVLEAELEATQARLAALEGALEEAEQEKSEA